MSHVAKKQKIQELKRSWWQTRISEKNFPEGVKCLHSCIETFLDEEGCEGYSFQYEKHKNGVLHMQITHKKRDRRSTVRRKWEDVFGKDIRTLFPSIAYCEPCGKEEKSFGYTSKNATRMACPDCEENGPWIKGKCPVGASRDLQESDLMPLAGRPWTLPFFEKFSKEVPVFHNKVYWIWSEHSEAGKTSCLGSHLALRCGAVLLGTSLKHALAVVFKCPAPIYYLNLARQKHENTQQPMALLETLSDMAFCSQFGDQTGMVLRKASWIIVFANEAPAGPFYDSGRVLEYKIDDDNSKAVLQ